jgi:hypothetical protein
MTIYVPPTGDRALDLVLEQLASNVGNISANTANIVTYNTDGSISAGNTIIGYRDRFMYVLFADDVYGTNASTSPVGRTYYGIVNTNDVVAPTSPLSYSYTKISGGFGTTKNLYYKTTGGRNIQWFVGTAPPNSDWVIQPNTLVYNPVDLDAITVVSGTPGANGYSYYSASVFQTSNTVPVAPTGGTFTFSTSTLVPPAGWSKDVPNANINVYQTSYLFNTNSGDVVTAGTWSAPSAVYRLGANGANGSNGFTTTVGVVYQANTLTPLAISSPGYYDFANTRLIAPTGWSNAIPNNPSNTTIWSSQASFVTANNLANVANTTPWTTPALTFQSGGVGAPGTRGFIPLAYVITSGDPTLYSQAQYTFDFSASRTNTIPPIGTGYAPIAGDTAQFAGLGKSIVKSFDGTNWVTAVGQVIDGSLIVTGTVTAAQMNTNSIYALTMRGGSVVGYNDTSNVGFWLDAGTGSALFTGNVIIGDTLTIGNLVTSASGIPRLAANTVGGGNIIAGSITATQIAAGTITADKLAANVLSTGNIVSFNATLGDVNSPGYWLQYTTGDVRFGGNVSIGANLNVTGLINGGVLSANTVSRDNFIEGTLPGSTGAGTVPQSVSAGPGTANWDGLDSSGSLNIYWKKVAYYEFTFPTNVPVGTSKGYSFNFTADFVGTNWVPSGTSGFPGFTFGFNGAAYPGTTAFKAGNPGTQTLFTKNYWGSTSFNGKVSQSFTFPTSASDWSTTATNYIGVWLTALPSNLVSGGTFDLTNITLTVTPI